MKKRLLMPLIVSLGTATTAATLLLTSCGAPTSSPLNSNGTVTVVRPSSSLIQQGLKEFASIKSTKKISTNARYNAQLQRVASRLQNVITLPDANWEFVVFEDSSPNAFALPGGKVGVHTGLFQITQTDAGLAAVVGHEIAHVTKNHAGSRQRQAVGIGTLGIIIDQVAQSAGVSDLSRATIGSVYGAGATVGAALPFSRKAELEADKIGAIYMAQAGYKPEEAVALWQRFAAYKSQNSSSKTAFLSTHPLDSTRINALRDFLPTAIQSYNPR